MTRKIPTPTATAPMSTGLGTPGTWVARTWRSGSDTVTMTPMRKLTDTTIHSLAGAGHGRAYPLANGGHA